MSSDPHIRAQGPPIIVAALYHFTRFEDPAALRGPLRETCEALGLRGTLLLAPEGINGTIAGTREAIDAAIRAIRALPGCDALEWKESPAPRQPFHRLKVRLKREIVTMGQPDVDPANRVGRYVDPQDWNALIARDDVVLIDTRNTYETQIGTFEGAIDPQTSSFGEFPEWWAQHRAQFEGKTVAMFCTGGIRCEKSTSWLVGQGVEDVVHLKGGILKYLEDTPEETSLWRGECFVFDQRVTVGHGLKRGSYALCYACRRPISEADMASEHYQRGVSCASCISETSAEDRARFAERQRQVDRAAARGEEHFSTKPKRG